MMLFRSSVAVLCGWALAASPAWSQAKPDQDGSAGKLRGKLFCLAAYARNVNPKEPKSLVEAFFDSPGIAPRPLPGADAVSFPIDTKNADAQRWFNQGMACLHFLMSDEAERAFRQVITLDPECAMGYWGLAMANLGSDGRVRFFSRLAEGKVKPDTPARAKEWIEAMARFVADPSLKLVPRLERLARDLEGIAIAHPDDVDAKALLFRQLVLNDYRGEVDLRSPWAVDRLATEVAAARPGHPSRNLRRVLWTRHRPSHLAAAGLLARDDLGIDAPALSWRFLAEAQQSVGRWEASAASLARAVEIGLQQRAGWFERPVHSPSFQEDCVSLIETLSLLGRTEEALDVADALMEHALPSAVPDAATYETFWFSTHGQGAWSYALVCHEHRLMDRLAAKMRTLEPVIEGLPAEARLRDELARWTVESSLADNANLSDEAIAHRSLAGGSIDGAMLSLSGVAEARRAAFLPRALWIIANFKAGRRKEALFAFDRDFRQQAGAADSPLRDHPVFREVAALRRVGSAWQLPATPESIKLSARVRKISNDLRSAYPGAPAFSLPDRDGNKAGLESFRGKPVIVIFFLGAGCYQCMEQLHTFLPHAGAYGKAGIPIVAISPDPANFLEEAIPAERRGNQPIPFTLLSDQDMEVFRRWFVFNDFEERPLHGTVLVDPEGKVRWSHINNRPFMKPVWLLKEAQRVLNR